jgi:hypothetical protein
MYFYPAAYQVYGVMVLELLVNSKNYINLPVRCIHDKQNNVFTGDPMMSGQS